MRPQAPTIIRELRQGTLEGTGPEAGPLVVDPHFELYSGIERGEPKPIPLKVILFEETPAFKSYIAEENRRSGDLFSALDSADKGMVIKSIPAEEYQRLHEFAYIQKDTRLDYTLVFQVDEFWTMKRPGIRRTGAARPAWEYLHAKTSIENVSDEKPEPIWAVDPYGWFQKTVLDRDENPPSEFCAQRERPYRRSDEFLCHGYDLMDLDEQANDEKPKALIDRVPFMWDFGFLLCRIRAWEDEHNGKRELKFLQESRSRTRNTNLEHEFNCVADVWDRMPKATKDGANGLMERPSWRVFLEACYHLARSQTYARGTPAPAFDLEASVPPGLSCLVLEIWASEILNDKHISETKKERFKELVSKRKLPRASKRKWPTPDEETNDGLIELISKYSLQLFKTWLLLVDVLNIEDLADAIKTGGLRTRQPSAHTVAVRHWYKTAHEFTQNLSVDDPVVPVGLPGHFSVRGDWFLAVAGGSRSDRLADQALDFFNTRSANYERLRCGLGLPVRRIVTDQLRTGIITMDRGDIRNSRTSNKRRRISSVHYENLIRLGGPVRDITDPEHPNLKKPFDPQGFLWFWRSSLADFPRHSRIWNDWLCQMILWWNRMREIDRDEWMIGFERYDRIARPSSTALKDIKAWTLFEGRCRHLIRELKNATHV